MLYEENHIILAGVRAAGDIGVGSEERDRATPPTAPPHPLPLNSSARLIHSLAKK